MQLTRQLAICAVGLAALTPAAAAHADVHLTKRTSTYHIDVMDAHTFTGATAHYKTTIHAQADALGDTLFQSIALRTAHSGLFWYGAGGVQVTGKSGGGTGSDHVDGTLDASKGLTGTEVFGYNTGLGANFNQSWIVRKNSGGHQVLEFRGGGLNLVDDLGAFTVDVFINGDWSQSGAGPHDHELVGLDRHWKIDDDFLYNGVETEFKAHISHYRGHDPNLDFLLFAAPVPELSSAWLFGGLMLAGIARGRLRRRACKPGER